MSIDGPVSVVVIGAGMVGASVGCALTAAGCAVHLEDRLSLHAQVAEQRGAGTTAPAVPAEVDLVVAAVPPAALATVIADALVRFPRATVTDVGSVKTEVLDALWHSGADRGRYVGSHPMAGSQLSGPLAARADLFVDRTWVVAPHRESSEAAIEAVEHLVRTCRAVAVRMDVAEHDRAVAQVSHLPHLVSALMAGHLTDVPPEALRLAGQGVRDVTRIAASDPALWRQIVAANAPAVLRELRGVQRRLADLVDALEADPDHGADRHLAEGVAGARRIPGKHGLAAVAYAHVIVEVPDRPGALAELFAAIGEAGANVEDLAIQHDPDRHVGYLSIAVIEERAASLTASMRAGGWEVRLLAPGESADPT